MLTGHQPQIDGAMQGGTGQPSHRDAVGTAQERYSTHLQGFAKALLCHCQISSPDWPLCCFISCWHQLHRPSSFSTSPAFKKHFKSLCTDSVCCISTKIYTNSTDPSSVDQNTAIDHSAQDSVRLREQWGPPQEHSMELGRSSFCLVGSFLVQPAVQVHGNRHRCNLWAARGESTP